MFLLLIGIAIGLFLKEFYKKYREGNQTLVDIGEREAGEISKRFS